MIPAVRVCDALGYVLAGLPVFPCQRDKTPLTPHGFKDASNDPAQIFAWWGSLEAEALGLATGAASGLWVLDVDAPKPDRNGDGPAALTALIQEHGPLPATVEQVTGGGGRHLFFAWPRDRLPVRNSAGKLGPGLDVRGEGGYVIVPPSLHHSGNRYAWAKGLALEEMEPPQAPPWLLAMARGGTSEPPPSPPAPRAKGATPYGQRALANELVELARVAQGERNEALNKATFKLGQLVAGGQLERGQVEAALLGAASGLGLPEREARATIKSGLEAGLREPRGPVPARPGLATTTTTDEEWQPDIRRWPVLPEAALSGPAGDLVRLACQDSEADPAAVLVTFLSRFGIEVGPSPHILVGDAKHPPRLFAVVVGASSKARKGTSGQPVQRVFTFDAQAPHLPAHNSPGPLSSGEGLVWKVRDPIEAWQVDRKTGEGKYVINDPGEDNKRLFVLEEEFAAALQSTKREGNTLSTILRTLWDSGNVDPLTKTAKAKTTGAHVGVVTHITAPELARLLDETEALNGFANRFLWVCAKRAKSVPFPQPLPQAEVAALQRRILAALEMGRELGCLNFDQGARALWLAAYPDLSQDHPGLAGTVINRGEAQVLRLALVYALLDSAREIRAGPLQSALALCGYCRDSALYIFGRVEADPITKRVLTALEAGPMTATELYKALGNSVSKKRLEISLGELIAAGRLEQIKEAGATKPKTIYRLTEKSEFSEISSPDPSAPQDNSNSSDNSPARIGNQGLWDGPAEVAL